MFGVSDVKRVGCADHEHRLAVAAAPPLAKPKLIPMPRPYTIQILPAQESVPHPRRPPAAPPARLPARLAPTAPPACPPQPAPRSHREAVLGILPDLKGVLVHAGDDHLLAGAHRVHQVVEQDDLGGREWQGEG